MRYDIIKEIPGRLRLQLTGRIPERDIDSLTSVLDDCSYTTKVVIYPRIGQIALEYPISSSTKDHEDVRNSVIEYVDNIDAEAIARAREQYNVSLAPKAHKLTLDLANLVAAYLIKRWFLPGPIKTILAAFNFMSFLKEALKTLSEAKLTVPVLDASAIAVSFLKKDIQTAGETMFLLNVGEVFEDYTRSTSENELIHSLLHVSEYAWLIFGEEEISVPANELQPNDLIVVRTGMSIVTDGTVEKGIAEVNQASLTGESIAVTKTVGDSVYAGTAVEDGELYIRVRTRTADTRLKSVVHMVDMADSQKSELQSKMDALADTVVPYNFALAALVGLITRDIEKVSAALMVDYSCALKLTGSVAVMSAMSQAARAGVVTKGAKYLELFSKADTIVFDKTGTLTDALPKLVKVSSFNSEWSEDEVLRLAACLEEHFPHPVARAIVKGAEDKNLKHRERHADVEYIVAHGIVSALDGERVVIGSKHFVVEDEHVTLSPADEATIQEEFWGLTPLYLAMGGRLIGVLGIQDPIKPFVKQNLATLRSLGFKRIIMLTGDSHHTAARIAEEAGIDEFQADMLPEDKFSFLEKLREDGNIVAMVGDGINDSPALSKADVGIAMGSGSDIAKEVADIVLTESNLEGLIKLRILSMRLVKRRSNSCAA
ncbi:MAG: heavy metal translocating P-type ATPase, partial [Eggerthellaceae bacterium]|nr:heavy metal translocating P-type ATPase [Eggerthellaceae bacterium]